MKLKHLVLLLGLCLIMIFPQAALANDAVASAQTSWFTVDSDDIQTSIRPGDTVDARFELFDISENATTAPLYGVYIWATDESGRVTDALVATSDDINFTTSDLVHTYYATKVFNGDTVTVSFLRKGRYTLHAGVATREHPSNVSQLTELNQDPAEEPEQPAPDEPDVDEPSTPAKDSVQMTIGNQRLVTNDNASLMDVAPYIKSARTYVPIRALSEAFDANVIWDNAKRTVTITFDNSSVVMTIGKNTASVNGKTVALVGAPEITHNRTFVPVRDVAELMGYTINYTTNSDGTVKDVIFER